MGGGGGGGGGTADLLGLGAGSPVGTGAGSQLVDIFANNVDHSRVGNDLGTSPSSAVLTRDEDLKK